MSAIVCSACSKSYKFKPELAGKKVKCACGQVLAVPAVEPEDDLLDLAPAAPVATTVAPPKPRVNPDALQAAIRNRVGIVPGKTSETKERERLEAHRREIEEQFKPNPIRDTIIPIILIPIGIVMIFIEARYFAPKHPDTFAACIPIVLMRSILAVGLMTLGMLIARAALDVTFVATIKQAALRFIAISLAPSALYGMLAATGDLSGPTLGILASVIAYGILFKLLLQLDTKDTAICVLTTWIMVTLANYIAFRVQGASSDGWL